MEQQDLFETEDARSLLKRLLRDSRVYSQSKDYKELLEFVGRLPNFAPFNAMLLHIQKPGLSYAASAHDWRELFGRTPKEGARPLLILWPFGPVALVYDVLDTEGEDLPQDVASFFAHGPIDEARLASFVRPLSKRGIELRWIDAGDRNAGAVRVIRRATHDKELSHYRLLINRNHTPPVQFATLAHELGHLFLGHLGADRNLKLPPRQRLDHGQQELEAESAAYLVCTRNGVASKSQTYLSNYVQDHTTVEDVDIYQIMHAVGQVEDVLGLAAPTRFAKPKGSRRKP